MSAVAHRWRWTVPAAVYLGILGLSSIPASRFEPLGAPAGLAYLAHAVEYGTLGATLRWALDDTARPWALAVDVAAAGVAAAVLGGSRRGRARGRRGLDL